MIKIYILLDKYYLSQILRTNMQARIARRHIV